MTGPGRMPETLWAKSPRGGRTLTLEQHLLDTEQAAQLVFDPNKRWGQSFCRFFKLDESERPRWLLHLRIAALFHDLGKANADFLAAVSGKSTLVQTLRHEHLSALLLHLPEMRGWLSQNKTLDLEVITAAVLSHHRQASEGGDHAWCAPRGTTTMRLFLQHPEVLAILRRVGEIAGISGVPDLPKSPWSPTLPWKPAWEAGLLAAHRFRRDIAKNQPRRLLLSATKVGVIVADSVASGLVRENLPIERWIEETAHAQALGPDSIASDILSKREEQIRKKRGRFEYHTFQRRAAEQGPRALLLAACGAGKTLAAWKWAEAQCRAQELGKVIFLYPTRGTATEGFRDYVAWAPEADAALLHGTSRYELEAMRENPSEGGKGKRFELSEAEARLFALGFWSRRYFSATVDQFLGFMEHAYTSLCLLPVLADAAVIVDEVHSFDKHMFDTLLSFLRNFDVPVLCMTASLTASRRAELERAGLQVYPSNEARQELHDLEAEERHPRYRIERIEGAHAAFAEAVRAYREGQRVLWVVNQVARAQAQARRLRAELGSGVRCYHSRYRLSDRKDIHAETVADFQQMERAAIAVTTQVCEMSLDLDADLLVTELAPAPSLVQRFGRANRHRARGNDFCARVLVYRPDDHLPYRREELHVGERFLDALEQGAVSQRDLAEALERHGPEEPRGDDSARFLSSGYFAVPGAFREIDEFSVSSVLDTDLEEIRARLAAQRSIDEFCLGVPRRAVYLGDDRPTWLPRYLGIARGDFYERDLGFVMEQGGEAV